MVHVDVTSNFMYFFLLPIYTPKLVIRFGFFLLALAKQTCKAWKCLTCVSFDHSTHLCGLGWTACDYLMHQVQIRTHVHASFTQFGHSTHASWLQVNCTTAYTMNFVKLARVSLSVCKSIWCNRNSQHLYWFCKLADCEPTDSFTRCVARQWPDCWGRVVLVSAKCRLLVTLVRA